MIPVPQPDGTATDSAARASSPARPDSPYPDSPYYQQLHPWQLIRHLAQMQRLVVGRFRSRSLAEAHLRALRRLDPSAHYLILFDPGERLVGTELDPDERAD
ncbi:MAG: hypothetical protein ACKO7W_09010 [Elainella sp.]